MNDMDNILVMQTILLIVLVFLCYLLVDLKEEANAEGKWLSGLILDNRARLMRVENRLDEQKEVSTNRES